jgi:hypothetical protein
VSVFDLDAYTVHVGVVFDRLRDLVAEWEAVRV